MELVRSRDPKEIASGQIVLDVGNIYDPKLGRFDHHQRGGAGSRENTLPFAAFGLIWKHFGDQICEDSKIAKIIEENLVMPIDAHDNGIDISIPNQIGVSEHKTSQAIFNFNTTWSESEASQDDRFNQALMFAKQILEREIIIAKAFIIGNEETEKQIALQNEPEILILNKYFDWEDTVAMHKNVKFVIYPNRLGTEWSVQVARDDPKSFKSNRATLPKDWWGLRDEELQNVAQVSDAIFCAIGGWFAKTISQNGAVTLAKKALQE